MKKIINFRTFLITSVYVICSILCGYLFYLNPLGIIPLLLLIFSALVLGYLYRKDLYKLLTFLLAFLTAITAFITISVRLFNYADERIEDAQFFTGRIISLTDNGKKNVVLDNLEIDGVSIDGKLIVNFYESGSENVKFLRYGDVLSVKNVDVYFNDLVKDNEFMSYYFIEDYRYTAYTTLNSVSVSIGEMNFLESMHFNVRNTLVNVIGEYGNIAYGVITGNKNYIDTEVREEYSISGLAHILAVSGLHIGFLVLIITLLLKLIKVKQLPSLIITGVLLLLYNFFIGGAVSAIRASIMAMAILSAKCLGSRSDSLNNLCLAVTIILTIMPQSIFDVGFLMSVGSVFGIIAIYPLIYKVVGSKIKNKVLNGAISVVCVSVSAQIGVFPVSVVGFNSIAPYSIISNLLVVPVLGLAYTYLLFATTVSMITPFASIVLYPVKLFFTFIGIINSFIVSIPYSQIVVYGTIIVYVLYLLIFITSRFVLVPKKYISIILAIIVSFSLITIENIPKTKDNTIIYSGSKWDVTSIVCTQGETLVIGDLSSNVILENFKEQRIREVDKLFLTKLNSYNVDLVIKVCKTYRVKNVYVNLNDLDNFVVFDLIDNGIDIQDVKKQKLVIPVFNDGEFCAYSLTISDSSVLFMKGSTNPEKLGHDYVYFYDYVRCVDRYENYLGTSLDNYESQSNDYVRKRVVNVGEK